MKDHIANQIGHRENPSRADLKPARGQLNSSLDRRAFLTGMGLGSAAFLLSPLHVPAAFMNMEGELLSCIGSFGAGDAGTLRMLHVRNAKSTVLHSVPSARPSEIVRHPFRSILYVANDVSQYQYQPRGTVETFTVDPSAGRLVFLGRQPLSLSATRPTSLAVSPDGRSLLVTAFGGGAYNVLPIDDAGLPGAPSTILKQVGYGEHTTEQTSAHPSHVLFHPGGQLAISADYGADCLDILAPGREDLSCGSLKVAARVQCAAGSGPREIALHKDGRLLAVAHNLRPFLATFRILSENDVQPLAHAPLSAALTAVCFHPEQDVLYSAQNQGASRALLRAWRIDPQNGSLQPASEIALPAVEVTAIHPDGSTLWLASDRGLLAVHLDPQTGKPYEAIITAAIPHARSVAILQ